MISIVLNFLHIDKSASVTSKTTKEPMAVDLSVVVVVTLGKLYSYFVRYSLSFAIVIARCGFLH